MKRPFAVKLRRYEMICGLIWLFVYQIVLGRLIPPALRFLGLPVDSLSENRLFYILGFLITAVLLWKFLRDSLQAGAKEPGRLLRGAFFGWCLYVVVQTGMGILMDAFAPGLSTPNDENIAALAAENYPMMLAGSVLLAPLTEEALLRGVLFGSLREKSQPAAYIVTALVFAGMHVIPYFSETDPGTAALCGLLYILPSAALCAAYELGGNIWAPVLSHAAINLGGMLALKG